MTIITDTLTTENEIVITENKTTTDFKIVAIHDDLENRALRVDVELGPFVPHTFGPEGYEVTRLVATAHRGIPVWHGAEYDAKRDTWTNADLIAAVASKV